MSIPEDDGRPDPLQRHLLCRATGMHDRGPEGVCRDCGVLTGPDSYVCADDTTGAKPAPDQLGEACGELRAAIEDVVVPPLSRAGGWIADRMQP